MKIASAEDIGRIIKQKRKDDGLTLKEAAAVCGVSYAFLSALENGKETVRLLVAAVGITATHSIRSIAGTLIRYPLASTSSKMLSDTSGIPSSMS